MRSIEDILKDMQEIGVSPETVDEDILGIQRSIMDQISGSDQNLSENQVKGAFKFILDTHKRRPIKQPFSISLNESGGVVLNRGNITQMSSTEIASRHKENLSNKEPSALRINHLLNKRSEETG